MRGITQEVEPTPWIPTPSALTMWTIGTGMLGGLASVILSRRAEKEGWTRFKTGYVLCAVLAASGLNIWLATQIRGEK